MKISSFDFAKTEKWLEFQLSGLLEKIEQSKSLVKEGGFNDQNQTWSGLEMVAFLNMAGAGPDQFPPAV